MALLTNLNRITFLRSDKSISQGDFMPIRDSKRRLGRRTALACGAAEAFKTFGAPL
jgi:hypothetical protein